jgi:lambda repressor-like predicted transcriptional regulator
LFAWKKKTVVAAGIRVSPVNVWIERFSSGQERRGVARIMCKEKGNGVE